MTQIRTKQKDFGLVTWYGMRWLFYCLLILTGISSSYAALPSSIPAGLILYDTGADLTGTYCSITLQQGTNVIFTTQLQSSGNAQMDMILVRFDSNGSLDKTFGFNGRIRIGPRLSGADIDLTGINGQLCSGVIQADGKIVLGGMLHLASESQHIWVLRLNQDGQLDKSFGNNGFYEQTNFSGGYYDKTAIAIDSEQRIIVANSTDAPIGSYYNSMGLVIRLTNNGQLDSSFNDTGSFVQNRMLFFSSILVQSDNSILRGGYNAVLIHLTSGGKLDTSFADNGTLNLPLNISSSFTMINSINSDSAGRIIATGYGLLGYYVTIIYRFDAKGNLDPSFVNGYVPYLGYTPAVSQLFNSSNIWLVGSTSVAYYDDYVAVASLKDDGTGNPFNTADISYPSTPTQRTWRMILDNNFCGEPAEGAIFQGDKILVLGTYNCRDYNGIYLIRFNPDGSIDETFGQSSPPPPEEKIPVVLVHGFDGSPGSFGAMSDLLTSDGFNVVQPFDYSNITDLLATEWPIQHIAGELAKHICVTVKGGLLNAVTGECSVTGEVDVVAHSMGGLVARSYMAGMAYIRSNPRKPRSAIPLPYHSSNSIRKLILVGSPAYGSLVADLGSILHLTNVQITQMDFGSQFILDLHQNWERILNDQIQGNTFTLVGVCNGRGDDGIVPYASAAMNDSLRGVVKYIVGKHANVKLPPECDEAPPIVEAYDKQHRGYQFIRDFLLGDTSRRDDSTQLDISTGMIVSRLYDSAGNGIRVRDAYIDGIKLDVASTFLDAPWNSNEPDADRNNKTEMVTLWPVLPKLGTRALQLVPPKRYTSPNIISVPIHNGQTTIVGSFVEQKN